MKDMIEILKKSKLLLTSIIISIGFYLYLSLARNAWYAKFYGSIESKTGITFSICYFLVLAFMIVLNDAIKGILKTKFILKQRKSVIFNDNIALQNSHLDISQRIAEDIKNKAEHFINAFDLFLIGLGLILVFLPRLFILSSSYGFFVFSILIVYSAFVILFHFGYLKKLMQIYLYKSEESEAIFRRFLGVWLNKRCIRPVRFDMQKFENAQNETQRYYMISVFVEAVRSIYENIGLITPFAVFYSLYHFNKINFATLIQLVNLWTQINYAVLSMIKGIERYSNYGICARRAMIFQDNVYNSDSLKIENLKIYVGKKKIINNFNLELKPKMKINIVAKNGVGKTSMMQAIQGFRKCEGKVSVPKNILWIPEQPLLPEKLRICEIENNMIKKKRISNSIGMNIDIEQFKKNCEIVEVDSSLIFVNASAAQKWRLIVAYAMCFEFVVWDDPFWGLDAQEEIKKFLPYMQSVLIFSYKPIDGMDIVEL